MATVSSTWRICFQIKSATMSSSSTCFLRATGAWRQNSIVHSALLHWRQPDCPPQEGWGRFSPLQWVAPSAALLLRLLQAKWGKSWPPSWHHGNLGLTSRWVQKQQSMPLGCMPATLMTTTGSWSWTSRMISTLCAGTRCCWLYVSRLQPFTPLSTLPIPHLPPCFDMKAYSSLQREYNREICWVPFLLSVHTRPLLPVVIRVQCMVPGWRLCWRCTGGH